jgi:hypothetical protein
VHAFSEFGVRRKQLIKQASDATENACTAVRRRIISFCHGLLGSKASLMRTSLTTFIDESALVLVEQQTFCPYKGMCSYYDIGDARRAAWSYREAYLEVGRISGLVSFEPDIVSVQLDGIQLRLEPGQAVIPHGPDRNLTVGETVRRGKQP